MATELETPSEYVNHHMTHLTYGQGFWTVHIDTLVMSSALAALVALILWLAARRASSTARPTGLGAFIEFVYEWVDNEVGSIYHGNRRFLTALALTGGRLRDQKFLLAGSGAAGIGIGRLLRTALKAEGLTDDEVRRRQVFVVKRGVRVCNHFGFSILDFRFDEPRID